MAEYLKVQREIINLNKNITLTVDIMFVCGLPFMVSISRKIKFTTVGYLPGRKQPILVNLLRKILRLYQHRGFKIETALMDRNFECLRDDTPELTLNTTAASEHVPDIERQIRVIKEHMRAIRSTLQFKRLPSRVIIEMMQYVVLWLNAPPPP
jgi:acetolactate synthase regulatory subunit